LQIPSQRKHFRVVDEQYQNRHSADLCPAFQFRTVPDEVIPPCICSRVEEANEFACLRIKPSNVGPFEAVAMDAGEGEIRLRTCAAVLAGDDVIDLKRSRMYRSRQLTIFASRAGSLPNPADELRIQCK